MVLSVNGAAGVPIGKGLEAKGRLDVLLLGKGPSDPSAILAYEKDAPEKGGYVVLFDGTVKKVSVEEFASTPKPAVK